MPWVCVTPAHGMTKGALQSSSGLQWSKAFVGWKLLCLKASSELERLSFSQPWLTTNLTAQLVRVTIQVGIGVLIPKFAAQTSRQGTPQRASALEVSAILVKVSLLAKRIYICPLEARELGPVGDRRLVFETAFAQVRCSRVLASLHAYTRLSPAKRAAACFPRKLISVPHDRSLGPVPKEVPPHPEPSASEPDVVHYDVRKVGLSSRHSPSPWLQQLSGRRRGFVFRKQHANLHN